MKNDDMVSLTVYGKEGFIRDGLVGRNNLRLQSISIAYMVTDDERKVRDSPMKMAKKQHYGNHNAHEQ